MPKDGIGQKNRGRWVEWTFPVAIDKGGHAQTVPGCVSRATRDGLRHFLGIGRRERPATPRHRLPMLRE